MQRKHIVAAVSLFVVSSLLVAPAIQGVPPSCSDELYSLYVDWLRGKPVGLAVFRVNPLYNGREFKGPLIITVINYSSGTPRVVLAKQITGASSVAFRIQRIPAGVEDTTILENGKVRAGRRTVFLSQSYFIGVVGLADGRLYSGGKFVTFEPNKPITRITINLKLFSRKVSKRELEAMRRRILEAQTTGELTWKGRKISLALSGGIYYTATPASSEYSTAVLPAGVIHAAPGTEVKWCLSAGIQTKGPTGIWYDSFYQDVLVGKPDSNSWRKGDKNMAIAHTDSCVSLDNAHSSQYRRKVVNAKVEYELDSYMVASSWLGVIEYVLVPRYIFNLVESPAQGESPPAVPSTYGTVTNSPQHINFVTNDKGPGWIVKEVTLTFGVESSPVEADVSITLYRAAGEAGEAWPPYLVVYNARGFKYWYKNGDPKSYEVYLRP